MNKDNAYKDLASKFVNYQKLSDVQTIDNNDPMVDVSSLGLKIDLSYSKIEKSSGNSLFLRSKVCELLLEAGAELKQIKAGYSLILVYAFRSLEIQTENFYKMKSDLGFGDRVDPEAMERTHHFIAVPEVSGHPTGAAIDLLITDESNQPIDFGTSMHALERNSYVFSPFISEEAKENRALLRKVMMNAGFAPYDGEWWHFSYGDQEWAAYYKKQQAFYSQLNNFQERL